MNKKNTYWRIMGFAKPVEKYIIPYFFYTLFYSFFYLFNFVMIVPILDVLFVNPEGFSGAEAVRPEFGMDLTGYLKGWLSYIVFDTFGSDPDIFQVLLVLAIVLVFCSLMSNLFRYLGQRTMENMRIKTLFRIRNAAFDNVMELPVGFFGGERKGDIISKITSDVQVVQFCITSTLQAVFRDPFLIIFFMLGMLLFSWQLTIFSVLFLPTVALAIGFIVKRLRRQATRGQETYSEMVSTLDESLGGVKIVKAYNAVDYIKDKFRKINGLYSDIMRSMARRQQLSSPISEFLGVSAMAVLLLFGGVLVGRGLLDGSAFIAFLAIFSQITRPVRSFADTFANINQGIAAGERVLALIDTKSTITDKPDAVVLKEFRDGIEFRDVRFAYDNREVVCGVNMSIAKGETVALVGASGGGKSTLSDLIPRFYDVQQGAVVLDGKDIRDYTLVSLRSQMGIVSQDTILFNDTIEGNIRMGKRDATIDEIVAAAKVANAHEFIMQTEEGYQTNIGDRGMKLSGGQRQRLSIARAVLKNPAILILDEATSALDTESEKLVQQALNSLLKGRTSIVIAHRLSTIRNADRIYVVEQGRIVEQGTHQQLMDIEGIYSRLVAMQHM